MKNSRSSIHPGPVNILIEGDNYHALSVLNYTIDPPYNTGNKDFIYNDDFVDAAWNGSILLLADYGTATFDPGNLNGGQNPALVSSDAVIMQNPDG